MTFAIALLLLTAVALVALLLHHLFEGEWLPADLLREWRLSRLRLSELDERCAKAPRHSAIVMSLTTTPSRIDLIETTLKSLLDQNLPPARIILNVPQVSKREGIAYRIPPFLTELNFVEIQRVDDLGPATKLIPTLERLAPDTPILVVDDDRIYPRWLVSHYTQSAAKYPDRALTMAGWIVPPDLTDRDTTIRSNLLMQPPAPIRAPRLSAPREIDVLLGVFSYLVRPRFFDLAEIKDMSRDPPQLFYVDDVRTSALCNVTKWVLPAPSLSFIPWRQKAALQQTRLGKLNAGPGSDDMRHNTVAIRHYRTRWRVGGSRRL